MPTAEIPISTISTRWPPAKWHSIEIENSEEEKIGPSPLVPEETTCVSPLTDPRALCGAFITTIKCIASGTRFKKHPIHDEFETIKSFHLLKAVTITVETKSCKTRIAHTTEVIRPACAATDRNTKSRVK